MSKRYKDKTESVFSKLSMDRLEALKDKLAEKAEIRSEKEEPTEVDEWMMTLSEKVEAVWDALTEMHDHIGDFPEEGGDDDGDTE